MGSNPDLGKLSESMQCDDIGSILVAGSAYTRAVGGNSMVVCSLGFSAKKEKSPCASLITKLNDIAGY